jgi:hypothetical protein
VVLAAARTPLSNLREALAQIVVHLLPHDELSQIAAALLDIVQQRADDLQLLFKLAEIEGLQQVRRALEDNFPARGDEVPAGSTRDVHKLVANHGFGCELRRGIVRDAGQPVALHGHCHFHDAVGLARAGEGYRPHFADADAIHADRRPWSQPGGVGDVEIHGGPLGEQRSTGQQVGEYREDDQGCHTDGRYAELGPADLARGRHSLRIVPRRLAVTRVTLGASIEQ